MDNNTRRGGLTPARLTSDEVNLGQAYRDADERGRVGIYSTAQWQAENYPRRAQPSLRLVAGGTA